MSDEQIIIMRISGGDQEALHELYARYRSRLRRYLWHQLHGDVSQVEEALQDVFIAVWQSAGSYRGDAQVVSWLFRIAHHRVSHMRRDTSRRPEGHTIHLSESDDEDFRHDGHWHTTSHEDEVIARLALGDALGHLSEKHRDVLELIFRYGFSLEEVAQILDIPIGTVKSRVSYARQALTRELAATQALEDEA